MRPFRSARDLRQCAGVPPPAHWRSSRATRNAGLVARPQLPRTGVTPARRVHERISGLRAGPEEASGSEPSRRKRRGRSDSKEAARALRSKRSGGGLSAGLRVLRVSGSPRTLFAGAPRNPQCLSEERMTRRRRGPRRAADDDLNKLDQLTRMISIRLGSSPSRFRSTDGSINDAAAERAITREPLAPPGRHESARPGRPA